VFVGGYRDEDLNSNNAWHLSPDYPHLDQVPDRSASLKRTHGEYLVFWPADDRPLARSTHAGPSWRWTHDQQSGYQWRPATLTLADGRLSLVPRQRRSTSEETAGFAFTAPVADAEAFPAKCPHCAADWGRRLGVKSPIRDLGTGFQRIMQILGDALVREIPPGRGRKLVLFSDSRMDAAKLSTGIKLAHYGDTLRQVAFRALGAAGKTAVERHVLDVQRHEQATELVALLKKSEETGLLPFENERRKELVRSIDGGALGELTRYAVAGGMQPAVLSVPPPLGDVMHMNFRQLLDIVRSELFALGMNPGGPLPSVARYQPSKSGPSVEWTELVDWSTSPPAYRTQLQPLEQALLSNIEASLKENVVARVLFASGARDFESLALGYMWIDTRRPASAVEEAAASVARLLAQKWRWEGSDAQGRGQRPDYVLSYLEQAAARLGTTAQSLEQEVLRILGRRVDQWLLHVDAMLLISPRPDPAGAIAVYRCIRCGGSHLHPSAGTCITCRAPLPQAPIRFNTAAAPADYYAFLARTVDEPFRLHCQELTGQTNRIDRRFRQRRFQEVFMADEVALAEGVDLLSVTTTMEAGVDIGALQAIALANMPPVRFNYQQRVGRAGRRGLGLSAALTLCRGRSHDDYYFERPKLITSEKPPRPYVDVTRAEIVRRVLNKEVLRRAFAPLNLPSSGDNVHGEFGRVLDWANCRPQVIHWLEVNRRSLQGICDAILHKTAFDSDQGRQSMVNYLEGNLVAEIDGVAQNSSPSDALSERLASHGILPMFGFPTRVRYLFHGGWPRADGGWPPERGVVDRDLDVAISQFAPGAQTVKDDQLLTAVGVVDFEPSGNAVKTAPNPLGAPIAVGICRKCQALVEGPAPTGDCPYCSAPRAQDSYRSVDLCEPPGFLTWFHADAEYIGSFEFTPRALRARMGHAPGDTTVRRNFEIDCGPARIHRVNDNDGNDFVFKKVSAGDIWIVDDAFQRALQDLPTDKQRAVRAPDYDLLAPEVTRALAAIATTDVLAAGIRAAPPGITLNPAVAEARAAWYSFGFLTRRAAAVVLDVAESELDVGIQPVLDSRTPFAPPSARIFMSDSLENGAGYSTHLGDVERFESLLRFMLGQEGRLSAEFYDPMVGDIHERECSGSCHRCLRDYGNMAYHPILDWRLALDMVRLALDEEAVIDLAQPHWRSLVQRQAGPYLRALNYSPVELAGQPAGHDSATGDVIILTHPIWDHSPTNLRPELAAAIAEAEARQWRWKLRTLFRATRFPYE
jgi:hypothetical protein